MRTQNFDDLAAFALVASERSFTRAAAKLQVSQSALSQTVKALERRLGFPLLIRSTRSVAPTEAGSRLLQSIVPNLAEIEHEIAALRGLRGSTAGTFRISAGEHPAISILQPALAKLLPVHPELNVEIAVDHRLVDIIADGYDAGVRLGERVAKDMVAVRIGPEMRMAIVGSPAYFERHARPRTPDDLSRHNCIVSRLPTHGGIFPWGLEKNGRETKVRASGQLVFNTLALRITSALDGLGLAYVPDDQVTAHVAAGRLIRVLRDWCPKFPGYHLYFPARRHPSTAFSILIDALRYRSA